MSKQTRRPADNKPKKPSNPRGPKANAVRSDLRHQSGASAAHVFQPSDEQRPKTLEEMMRDVERRQNEYDDNQQASNEEELASSERSDMHERSRKAFYREFKRVVDGSDIIIEVLDARDPLGCRCPQVEEAVLTSGKNKKLILLLNKIDLIPRANLDQWLKYLRNEFPTIAFRSSTQNQRDRLGHVRTSVKTCDEQLLRSSNKCIGASTLMNLLSNYCRKNDIKTSITVGVVGYPNVGKSSVINSLKRSQACETGSTPGLTKQMQTVKLDKLIKLFDSPGIVMSKETDPAALVLRNCVRIETIEDPLPAIELLLHRCTKERMMRQYNVPDFQDASDFLMKMASKMGTLKRGGVPDTHQAAQRVLSDWTNGKLTYFTEPPERAQQIIHSELVTQMREAFDIDALLSSEDLERSPSASSRTEDDLESEGSSASTINDDSNEVDRADDQRRAMHPSNRTEKAIDRLDAAFNSTVRLSLAPTITNCSQD